LKKSITDRIKKIKLVALDVDGVMTNGGIILGSDGNEYKTFQVKDGTGITLGRYAGLKFAIISGRYSKVIDVRAKELMIDVVYQDVMEKIKVYDDIKEKFKLRDENICFVGDDVIDIPVMEKCGFAAAPDDAVHEVRKTADYICEKAGGDGCVREVMELILKKQGLWDRALKRYLRYEKPGA
jgi:3-deoxy-D-manno-octulosonate 8-phosphate phosphatase (KDO 8-P phosphatase)